MRIINTLIGILIKTVMIIWGIISLLLLALVSIVIYFVFIIKVWFIKRKIYFATKKTSEQNYSQYNKHTQEKIKTAETKESSTNTAEIKTIKRNLETKDGEFH